MLLSIWELLDDYPPVSMKTGGHPGTPGRQRKGPKD